MTKGIRVVGAVLGICMIIGAIALLASPKISELRQEQKANTEISAFLHAYWNDKDPTETTDNALRPFTNPLKLQLFPDLYLALKKYNEEIYQNGQKGLSDPWAYQVPAIEIPGFDINKTPIGILTIPKLEFKQPIYIGATASHLEAGVAQLAISSMPIGGTNTNSVLAGHRGWKGAPYLRYIDKLEIGDEIIVTNFWESMIYRVEEIRIIAPHEAENILIQPGRDLVTILTCHPYGTGGRQRILVICERVLETQMLSAPTISAE